MPRDASPEERNVALVREMFSEFASKLDASKLDVYHTPDFEMFSNDVHWDRRTYDEFHQKAFRERKALRVRYHDIFGQGDRVAARVDITLVDLDDTETTVQVMLIAQISGGKIRRLWELTFPPWQ
ncbi:nuclear transport factor 2 family protein [Polyangium sp. y55x31]|uniref:nuclear transport factor 2 family protein n=1 Tax=Polyangium sp. y55x31 TaxID=3042688 RepID=UPI002482FAA7|nr:nuclear transport factor 2 family protein [Polyangium sp. y55x31]MDI1483527.1 nuclear transport factor 2 family protein [Polyangium sp. y55x31]